MVETKNCKIPYTKTFVLFNSHYYKYKLITQNNKILFNDYLVQNDSNLGLV